MDTSKYIVSSGAKLLDCMKRLDESDKKILFVTDSDNVLVGAVTDGDIRRWILNKQTIDVTIDNVMYKNPVLLTKENEHHAERIMHERSITSVPIVDESKHILSIVFLNSMHKELLNKKFSLPVVIMAGGEGKRLYPYTKVLPKPLVPIGDITIVERIMDKFLGFGCEKFFMSVNYKKHMIKAYFNDLDYDISYIEEDIPLGTGGSLYYLKELLNETFFLSNCDILVNADYNDIYKFHKDSGNLITVIASLKKTIIPYGVIELDENGAMCGMLEKPEYNHLINTGMYILEPQVLKDIDSPKFIHLTDIIGDYIKKNVKVGVYPVGEKSWIDMGQIKEMESMISEITKKTD